MDQALLEIVWAHSCFRRLASDTTCTRQGGSNTKAIHPSKCIHVDFSLIFRPGFLSLPGWKAVVIGQLSSLLRGSTLTLRALPTAHVWEAFASLDTGSQVYRAAKCDTAYAKLGSRSLETSALPGENWIGSTRRHLGGGLLETTSCSPAHMEGANQFLQKGAERRNLPRSATLWDSEGMRILTEGLELKAYS